MSDCSIRWQDSYITYLLVVILGKLVNLVGIQYVILVKSLGRIGDDVLSLDIAVAREVVRVPSGNILVLNDSGIEKLDVKVRDYIDRLQEL